MPNVGGEADNIMAEVDTLIVGDQDLDRGGDSSPIHEQRLDASLASSAHVVPDPRGSRRPPHLLRPMMVRQGHRRGPR
jgi:hypothetical protein